MILFDWVNIMNLLLCVFIVILGCIKYSKTKNKFILYTTLAFGLFGISHLMALLKIGPGAVGFLTITRLVAYLLVIFAMVQ